MTTRPWKADPFPPAARRIGSGALLSLAWAVFFCPLFPAATAFPAIAVPPAPVPATARTIIDLQPFRHVDSIRTKDNRGGMGSATLINLNPGVNAWYLQFRISSSKFSPPNSFGSSGKIEYISIFSLTT
jgi:hypothetical protein